VTLYFKFSVNSRERRQDLAINFIGSCSLPASISIPVYLVALQLNINRLSLFAQCPRTAEIHEIRKFSETKRITQKF